MRKLLEQLKNILVFDWLQAVLLLITAPFFLFPSQKMIWIYLIFPLIWIFRWFNKKSSFERTPVDLAVLVLLFQVFLSCILISDLHFSLPKIAGIILGIILFYTLVNLLNSEKLIKTGILFFLFGGFCLSIFSFFGIYWESAASERYSILFMLKLAETMPKINWNLPGARGGFNANAIGGILIIFIPLSFFLIFQFFNSRKKYIFLFLNKLLWLINILFFISLVGVLLITQSIGSWISLIIAFGILFPSKIWKKGTLALLILFILTVIIIPVKREGSNFFDMIDKKIEIRKPMWTAGINAVKKNPFWGIGLNHLRLNPLVGYSYSHAHNHLLHTAAELGIPALIAYLAILVGAGYMCLEVWRKAPVGWVKATALGLGTGQLAHFIFGFGDSIPLGAKPGVFFWVSLALIAAMYNVTIKQKIIEKEIEE